MKIKERKWFFIPLLLVLSLLACMLVACDASNDENQDICVVNFEKVGSEGKIDTYKITYSDGTSTTFTVTNGTDGTNGIDGIDGVGIYEVKKTSSEGMVDTYTIYFTDGSTATFTVTNGNSSTGDIITDDAFTYYPLDDGTLGIGGGSTKYLSSISIPSEYKGKTVTMIVADAFSNFTNLQEIAIPNTIKYIDDNAFYKCNALKSIAIPCGVIKIGEAAFSDCSSLTSVKLSDSVSQIEERAFSGCTNLQSVIFGKNITLIGDGVFSGCKTLKSIALPDSVMQIGNYAFSMCTNLQTIELGKNLDNIGLYVFSDCKSLNAINVSQANQKYVSSDGNLYDKTGCLIYYNYGKLAARQSLILTEGVTKIADGVFPGYFDFNLTELVLPDSLVEIGKFNEALFTVLVESEYSSQWYVDIDKTSMIYQLHPELDGASITSIPSSLTSLICEVVTLYKKI